MFELGLRFRRDPGNPSAIFQEPMVAGLISGPASPEQWGTAPARPVDFYDLKADVESLLALGGKADQYRIETGRHPALHPGQCARVVRGDEVIGWLGRLHPNLAQVLEVKEELPLVYELRLDLISEAEVPVYKAISDYPSSRRDLALVLPEKVNAARLLDCIKSAGEANLRDVFIFDVYRGQGLQSGFKSIALGLIFQDYSRTLTDTEVDQSLSRLQERARQELGATVRG
jgi:phenylalanyl-tRNA synthetase beta chain